MRDWLKVVYHVQIIIPGLNFVKWEKKKSHTCLESKNKYHMYSAAERSVKLEEKEIHHKPARKTVSASVQTAFLKDVFRIAQNKN